MAMSDYLEEQLLNEALRAVDWTPPATVYLALHTTDPLDDDSGGGEVTGGSYARQAMSFAAAVNPDGTCATDTDITFPTASADWGVVTHIGIYDAVSAGNLLFHGALDTARNILNGDVFKVTSGQLVVSLD